VFNNTMTNGTAGVEFGGSFGVFDSNIMVNTVIDVVSNSSNITNNTMTRGEQGMTVRGHNNTIINNTIDAQSTSGMTISSHDNIVYGNHINNSVTAINMTGTALRNNNITMNTVTYSTTGIILSGLASGTIEGNNLQNNTQFGIRILASNNTLIRSNVVNASKIMFDMTSGESRNINLSNNTFHGTTIQKINGTNLTAYDTTFKSAFGNVFIPFFDINNNTVFYSGASNFSINNNSAFINTTALPDLNVSANITFTNPPKLTRGIPIININDTAPFTPCREPPCSGFLFESITGMAAFTVGHFTNYSTKNDSTPTITSIIVNASTTSNTASDNLTAYLTGLTDADNDTMTVLYNWYINDSSTMALNLPFTAPDEGNRTYDFSGNDNHGNITGPVFNKTGGADGFGAYRFDGIDDYISIKDSASFNFTTTPFSVEAWIYKNGNGTPGESIGINTIMIKGNPDLAASKGAYALFIFNHLYPGVPGQAAFAVSNGAAWLIAAGPFIENDRWYHLVGVWNTTDAILYLNGTFQAATPAATTVNEKDYNLTIGAFQYSDGTLLTGAFNGTIDNVRIYNRSLSQNEISLLYLNITNTTHFDATMTGDTWSCMAVPIDYWGYNGTSKLSNGITISTNTAPSKPNLTEPSNGNATVFNRTVTFFWNATDTENDPLNYTLNISNTVCPGFIIGNIAATNYTVAQNLCLDNMYTWYVYASDGTVNGTESDVWNFTVASALIMTLTNNTVDFGDVIINNEYNTSYEGSPNPLVIQNDGNVEADVVRMAANKSLWTTYGLNNETFRFKANNRTTEMDAFNWPGSITDWSNVTDVLLLNKTVISQLNFTDSKDNAEIDFRIKVPAAEPPGSKFTNIVITGAVTG
ncbi:MAG TPA: LamG-like jellyroll fold domain-containing protein, partial [Candidatus Nanoarchaeia archaeon]|nr:LamG-like jellyroll fold domain-containing protein [Candidatus Nanoarchaeia archaeon]